MHLEARIKELEKQVKDDREEMKQYREIICSLTKTLENLTTKKEEDRANNAVKTEEEDKKQENDNNNKPEEKKFVETDTKISPLGKRKPEIENEKTTIGTTAAQKNPTTSWNSPKWKFPEGSLFSQPKEESPFLVMQDTMVQRGLTQNVLTKYMTINSKPEKADKCLEELRWEHQMKNKKGDSSQNSTASTNGTSKPFGAFPLQFPTTYSSFKSDFETLFATPKPSSSSIWSAQETPATRKSFGEAFNNFCFSEVDTKKKAEENSKKEKINTETSWRFANSNKSAQSFPAIQNNATSTTTFSGSKQFANPEGNKPFLEKYDTQVLNGVARPVMTKYLTITSKPENADKSIEELRWDHDSEKKKKAANTSQNLFASTSGISNAPWTFPPNLFSGNSKDKSYTGLFAFGESKCTCKETAQETSAHLKSVATSSNNFTSFGLSVPPKPQENQPFFVRPDIMLEKGREYPVWAKLMSINSRPENNGKSIEEIRLENDLKLSKSNNMSQKWDSSNSSGIFTSDYLEAISGNMLARMREQTCSCSVTSLANPDTNEREKKRSPCYSSANVSARLANGNKCFMCSGGISYQQASKTDGDKHFSVFGKSVDKSDFMANRK